MILGDCTPGLQSRQLPLIAQHRHLLRGDVRCFTHPDSSGEQRVLGRTRRAAAGLRQNKGSVWRMEPSQPEASLEEWSGRERHREGVGKDTVEKGRGSH